MPVCTRDTRRNGTDALSVPCDDNWAVSYKFPDSNINLCMVLIICVILLACQAALGRFGLFLNAAGYGDFRLAASARHFNS